MILTEFDRRITWKMDSIANFALPALVLLVDYEYISQ